MKKALSATQRKQLQQLLVPLHSIYE